MPSLILQLLKQPVVMRDLLLELGQLLALYLQTKCVLPCPPAQQHHQAAALLVGQGLFPPPSRQRLQQMVSTPN